MSSSPVLSPTHADRKRWPAWLWFLGGLLLFAPLLEGGTTHQAVMIIRIMILTLLALYLWAGIRHGALVVPRLPIGWPVAGFLLLAVASTIRSPYTHQSVQWLVVLSSYAVLLCVTVGFIRDVRHVHSVLMVLGGMAALEAALTLGQAWSGDVRPHGTFFNPNFLAGYLIAVGMPLLSVLCFQRLDRRSWPLTLVSCVVLAVFTAAVALTGSRGGLMAALAGVAVVLVIRFRWKGLGALALLVGVLILIPNPLRERVQMQHVFNPVGYARLQIWQSSLHSVINQPSGYGLGLYQYVYPRYAQPVDGQVARYGKIAHAAHNEYLQMAVEMGVISVPIFLWGVVQLISQIRRTLGRSLHPTTRGVLVGLAAGLAAMLVHAAVDAPLHEPALAILLTVYVGLIVVACRDSDATPDLNWTIPLHSKPMYAACTVIGIAGLAVLVSRFWLGWMAYEAGVEAPEPRTAISRYQTAIDLDPGKALYHSALAAAYFKEFQSARAMTSVQAAVTELQTAIDLNPLDGRLPGLLGHVYLILGASYAAASTEQRMAWLRAGIAAYQQAIVLEPFIPSHRLGVVQLLQALGQLDRAEAEARRAVEIEPNFLPAREWLARRYLRSGRLEAASQQYDEIVHRQHEYADRPKDPVEERYLDVNAPALAAELHARRPS